MKRPINSATRDLVNYYTLIITHNNKLLTSRLLLVCGKRESLLLSWILEFV